MADWALRPVVRSYKLDVGSDSVLRIQHKELLFDNTILSKEVDDRKSSFTRMEVLDVIYDQFLFTANNLGCQPTTSPYVQLLAPQTLAREAAAIQCGLCDFTSAKKAMVMFSQDEYGGTFGPSPVINFILEATAQSITHQRLHHTSATAPCSTTPVEMELLKPRQSFSA